MEVVDHLRRSGGAAKFFLQLRLKSLHGAIELFRIRIGQLLEIHWAVLVAVTLADVFEIANGIGSESGTGKFLHLAFPLIASGHKKSALICGNFSLRRAGGRTGGRRTAIGQLALDTTPKRFGRLNQIND